MRGRLRRVAERWYERLLLAEVSEVPSHVAVIQDGNRRYAASRGSDAAEGHRAGTETTEQLLRWCEQLGIEEITLYAFSTENFDRPDREREMLFDLVTEKLRSFADEKRVHEAGIRIRAIGETDRLPGRVRSAIEYAEGRTAEYDTYNLNVALAYGGRAELLGAAREIAQRVECGDLDPSSVDLATVDDALYEGPTRDVDLIVRSGGDERTSNFLPWQANGNEAAVYFSAPYWPEFRKLDFLRGIRTYENRDSRRRGRLGRARAGLTALGTAVAASRPVARVRRALPGTSPSAAAGDDTAEDGEVDIAD